jgi:23S rRNA (adenine2503-C2)-methyltransferase
MDFLPIQFLFMMLGMCVSSFKPIISLSKYRVRCLSSLINFYSTPETELVQLLQTWGHKSYRAKQVREWIYDKGAADFDDMKNIPPDLRERLKAFFSLGQLRIASEQCSRDGTIKRAYELKEGQLIESVLMPYEDGRRTACISSQAGCAMGCVFCATGQMGFSRQLSSAEIFEQAQLFSAKLKRENERLSNIVLMGMGEPLANYDNVFAAIKRFSEELGIGSRHITISTVGIAPRIRKLADEHPQIGLAISLHQVEDAKRDALMPVNKRYPIAELLHACRYFIKRTGRRITFEWALIKGETDTEAAAHQLGQLLEGMMCHVNVIPLNPTKGYGGKPTSKIGVENFVAILGQYGVSATPRTRRGCLLYSIYRIVSIVCMYVCMYVCAAAYPVTADACHAALTVGIDIDAGCGQLKADLLRKSKPELGERGPAETAPLAAQSTLEAAIEERERVFSEN